MAGTDERKLMKTGRARLFYIMKMENGAKSVMGWAWREHERSWRLRCKYCWQSCKPSDLAFQGAVMGDWA